MSSTVNDLNREKIRRTLAHLVRGGSPDANAMAEASISTWHKVIAQLTPVIGTRGVDVLFSRSLHITSITFPWIINSGDHGDSSIMLVSIKARLAGHDVDVATEASHKLLLTFTELLTSLIGESLTERLLDPVWVSPSATSQQEIES